MVRAREMRGENEGEAAAGTLGGEAADPAAAARALVSFFCGPVMARAVVYAASSSKRTRGKAHHEEACIALFRGAGYGGSCDFEE